MIFFKIVVVSILCLWTNVWAAGGENTAEVKRPKIYLQPNTTQLFTELYQAYGLLSPPLRTFFENALYLDQSIYPSILPLQPSDQAILDHTNQVLSEFHRRANDLELYVDPSKPKPFFYTASGSKHLIMALVYGIVMSEPHKKFLFVEQAPYFFGHPDAVTGLFNYTNARFLSFHDPSEIKLEPGEVLVEFVTSPNNPDGKFRKPLTNAEIIIADFVFASSSFGADGTGYVDKNIEWMRKARAEGKHVFSFNSASKQFGKTGTRCGYIWYPIYDSYASLIFKHFFNFIASSTVAGGTSGLADFLDLIKALLDLPDTGNALRKDCQKSLVKRHELVARELLSKYPGSQVISIPGSPTFFAKIKDPRIPDKAASDVMREDLGVDVTSGELMGETNEFMRLNLLGYSQVLVEFLNRLADQNKYTVRNVLLTSAKKCSHSIISAQTLPHKAYYVSPGDCLIDADAFKGSIEIVFPQFIDYESSTVITIKKIDASDHQVFVNAENIKITLKKCGESVDLQWTQPLYYNGHWNRVKSSQESD